MAVRERLLGTVEVFRVVQRAECDLLRIDPRPTAAEMSRYYPEHYAPHQPANRGPEPWLSRGLKSQLRR